MSRSLFALLRQVQVLGGARRGFGDTLFLAELPNGRTVQVVPYFDVVTHQLDRFVLYDDELDDPIASTKDGCLLAFQTWRNEPDRLPLVLIEDAGDTDLMYTVKTND